MQLSARIQRDKSLAELLAYIDGDDICHSRESGQSGTDFGIKTRILYLFGLCTTNRSIVSKDGSNA